MAVPAPMETTGEADLPQAVVKFRCPACRRKFAIKAELAGKKIRCSGCGAGVRVPQGDENAVDEPSRPAVKTYAGTDGATASPQPARSRPPEFAAVRSRPDDEAGAASPSLDELASIDGVALPKRAGTVLSSRSEMMEQVRQKAAEETVATQEKAEKSKKKKKKRKQKTGYFDPKETLILVAGVGALVAVLALVAWGYPDFRFPLGGILCVVGFIVYLLGAASLRQLVAEEGVFKALLFRFCPPYQWWYVATNWAETKDFVAFFGAGLLILSIGGAVIKSSPIGKKAEASDRAYQQARRGGQAAVPPAPSSGGAADVE